VIEVDTTAFTISLGVAPVTLGATGCVDGIIQEFGETGYAVVFPYDNDGTSALEYQVVVQ